MVFGKMKIWFFLIFYILNQLQTCYCVPFLAWKLESEDDNMIDSAPRNMLRSSQIGNNLDQLDIKNGIFVNLEELCTEDISLGKNMPFISQSFKEAMNGKRVHISRELFEDNIQDDILHHFKMNNFTRKDVKVDDSVLQLEDSRNLLVINFNNINTQPMRSDAFKKIDEVLGQFLDGHIKKAGKEFAVIFTGNRCPMVTNIDKIRVGRSLQQFKIGDPVYPDNFYYVKCLYILFHSHMTLSLTGADGTFADVPAIITHEEPVSSCTDADQQWITLSYSDVTINTETFHKLKLKFLFNRHLGSFHSSGVEADYMKGKSDPMTKSFLELSGAPADTIPVGHSYACGETLTFVEKNSSLTTAGGMTLNVNGWQVQPFRTDADSQFGPSWDCVGFFTIGIWMGLLTGIMLILILFYGMAMIVNIKTMDRFDDPKGKTVFVVQATD